MSRVRARPVVLLLGFVAPCHEARPADTGRRLFVIERNLNANAVAYDVVTTGTGRLDPGSPLRVYWIMWAESGQVKELSVMERSWVYGYDVHACAVDECTVSLRALRDRQIVVEMEGGSPRAITTISDGPAFLRRVYVTVSGAGVFASVESVELFGESCTEAAPVSERITPH